MLNFIINDNDKAFSIIYLMLLRVVKVLVFSQIMNRKGDQPPQEGDELPEGYVSSESPTPLL